MWASDQQKLQKVIDRAAVVVLTRKRADRIKDAYAKLISFIPTIEAASRVLGDPQVSTNEALIWAEKGQEGERELGIEPADQLAAQHFLTVSRKAVAKAHTQVLLVKSGIPVSQLAQDLKNIESAMTNISSLTNVINALNQFRKRARELQDAAADRVEIRTPHRFPAKKLPGAEPTWVAGVDDSGSAFHRRTHPPGILRRNPNWPR